MTSEDGSISTNKQVISYKGMTNHPVPLLMDKLCSQDRRQKHMLRALIELSQQVWGNCRQYTSMALMATTQGALGGLLDEHSLALEDAEGLLESSKLGLSSSNLFRVWLSLGDAHFLQLRKVLHDRIELCLGTIAI